MAADLEGARLPGIKEAAEDAWQEAALGVDQHPLGADQPGITSEGLIEEAGSIDAGDCLRGRWSRAADAGRG